MSTYQPYTGSSISFGQHILVPRAHQVEFLNSYDKICQKVKFSTMHLMYIAFLYYNFYQRYRENNQNITLQFCGQLCTGDINGDSNHIKRSKGSEMRPLLNF